MLTEPFNLEPHPSGKNTCFVLTTTGGLKRFVKFPRTVDDSVQGVEEMFSEFLGESILAWIGASRPSSSIEVISFKVALVREYCEKNWSDVAAESLKIVNNNEWPLFLAAETLMHQTDRSLDKHEHIGLSIVDEVDKQYKAVPLDLGHAFVGFPGGYHGLDEDLTPEWIDGLFWAHREFSRSELENAITKAEELPVIKVIYEVVNEILKVSNWPESTKAHLWKHADKVAFFLLIRQKKIREVLLRWWDQKYGSNYQKTTVPVMQAG